MAAGEYVRPTLALVLGGCFAFATVGVLLQAIQTGRALRQLSNEGELEATPEAVVLKRNTILWTIGAVVLAIATIIALNWRVLRKETEVPAPLASTERIGGVKILTVDRQYPEVDADLIPLNTSVYLWFTLPMDRKTLIDDKGTTVPSDDEAAGDHVRMWRGGSATSVGQLINIRARSTPDLKIFAFDPISPFSSGGNSKIFVELRGLKTTDGQPLFGQEGIYRWSFTVAQNEDRIAPTLQGSFPKLNAQDIPANAGIQLGWSEAMDPISFSSGVQVRNGTSLIAGAWTVAEGERLSEFFPTATCAQNQCRRNIGCFPFGGSMELTTLVVDGQAYPRQGVRDLHGNIISAAAQTLLRYTVGRRLEQSLPSIVAVEPLPNSSSVSADVPVSALFSTIVRAGSVDKRSVRLGGDGDWRAQVETNFKTSQSRIRIFHQPLLKNQILQGLVASDVEDIYQNCFAQCKGP